MVSWKFLQTSFVQGILTYIPSLRKSIEPPAKVEDAETPSPSPVVVEPWKEEVDRWKQLADKTSAERDKLRHEAGQLHSEMQRLVQDLAQARTEAEENWRVHEEELRKQAEEEVSKRERALREKEEEMSEALRTKEQELSSALRAKEDETSTALQAKEDERSKLAEELSDAHRERDEARTLLEIRKLELSEAQTLVGKDGLEELEVLKLLEGLNEEIVQAAKSIKDAFKVEKAPRAGGKAAAEAAGAIEGWVGSTMPVLLSTQARGNPLLVQAALQAMAVAFSSWISSSYSFMHEHDQVLDETYKYLMNSENQTVLGRWRALTHKYAKQGMPNLTDELTKMLITDVRNLLIVAGSSVGQVDALIARKRDSFRSIVEAAIAFRRAIGEEIISCDFETILIHPGDAFDGASMTDSYEIAKKPGRNGEEAAPARKVLCTAGLGLRRCKKVRTEGEPGGQWEVSMLYKPHVILDTVTSA